MGLLMYSTSFLSTSSQLPLLYIPCDARHVLPRYPPIATLGLTREDDICLGSDWFLGTTFFGRLTELDYVMSVLSSSNINKCQTTASLFSGVTSTPGLSIVWISSCILQTGGIMSSHGLRSLAPATKVTSSFHMSPLPPIRGENRR